MARALGLVVVLLVLLVVTNPVAASGHSGATRDACLSADRACVRCRSGGGARAECAECAASAVLIDGTCSCPAGSGQTGKTYSSGKTPTSFEHPVSVSSSASGAKRDRLTCSACDAGAFAREASKSVRAARCTKCPPGTTTRGARGSTTCFVRAGFYFDPARPRGQQVVPCPQGEVCNGGDIFGAGRDHVVVVVDDPCSPNPCLNGGACTKTGASSYTCSCAAGFSGADCGTARARIIRTIAGTGVPGRPEQRETTATKMLLNSPVDVVLYKGFYYIVDEWAHWILKVGRDGQARVFAGTGAGMEGSGRFAGDGGPAELANLNFPTSIVFDADDDSAYVADRANNRVRKIDKNGIITTVAGNGQYGSGGDGGKATEAQIYFPGALALDGKGNLFIAQAGSIIRKVSLRDGTIQRFAGTGVSGYSGEGVALEVQLNCPSSLACMNDGSLVFSDSWNNRIRKITPEGIISTIAGDGTLGYEGDGGPATSARLRWPYGVTVAASGTVIYFTDLANSAIRKIDASGKISSVAAGRDLLIAKGLYVDDEDEKKIYVADEQRATVSMFGPDGAVTTVAGIAGSQGCLDSGGVATSSRLNRPTGVAVDSALNVFVADYENFRVRKISDNFMTTVAGSGSVGAYSGDGTVATKSGMDSVQNVACDGAGNLLITLPWQHPRVRKVSTDGTIRTVAGTYDEGDSGDGGPATSALLRHAATVAVTQNGRVFWIADQQNHKIRKVEDGIITTFAGTGQEGTPTPGALATTSPLSNPSGVALAASGDVFISQRACVLRVSARDGTLSIVAGSCTEPGNADGPAAQARFNGISDLDVDSAGVVYCADTYNNAVRVIGTDGVVTRLAGSATGTPGYSGDNGPAAEALLNWPMGVAVDREGGVYVADTDNSVIRKIEK